MARRVNVAVLDKRYIHRLKSYYETIFKRDFPKFNVNFKTLNEDYETGQEQAKDLLSDAEIVIMSPQEVKLTSQISKSTKWVQWTWAGVEALMNDKCRSDLKHCAVTRATGIFGQYMAEYVVGAVIAMEKDFPAIYKQQMEKKWDEDEPRYRALTTLSIGVLGLGAIGKDIAKFCSQLGMTVYGMKRSPSQCEHVKKVFSTEELPDLIKLSDYICNVLPSTSNTKGILSEDILKLCSQRKAKFINVGRGDVVQEETLIKALENGWLSGAFLDVFENEPLDKRSPLWSLENVVITPHIAGVTDQEMLTKLFFSNLEKYLKNEGLDYVIDFDAGY